MDRDNRQEEIEKFLENTLEGEELINFEEALLTDEELAMDVEISKDIKIALDDVFFEKDLTTKLDSLGKKYLFDDAVKNITPKESKLSSVKSTRKIKRIPFYRRPWAVAATVLLVVLGGIGINRAYQNIDNTPDVFASYYEAYPSSQITRGDNTIGDNQKKTINFYENSDYEKAIPLLLERITIQPSDTPSKILLANCYLNTTMPQIEKAVEILQPLTEGSSSLYQETARWYLALAYIKKGKPTLAKPYLEVLAARKVGKYPRLAQEVLTKL